jgi:hypothetical protein
MIQRAEDSHIVVLGSAHIQADRSIRLASVLFAIVLPMVLSMVSFAAASATDAGGRAVEPMVVDRDLATLGVSQHDDDDCGHDHESAECSPCSSCSTVLPSRMGPPPNVMTTIRVSVLKSHYNDVVPESIHRPPRFF